VQTLLAERFQLAFHRGSKASTAFSLVVAKGGLRIQPDQTEGRPGWSSTRTTIVAQRISLTKVAESLSRYAGAPVVDATGLAGVYSFKLEFTPETLSAPAEQENAPPSANFSGPSLFTVLQKELGLRLEPRKTTVETLVIDKAGKPSDN
jgi:uncharacterized protein (TIGR03435 family)